MSFDLQKVSVNLHLSLNPFGTGQCLSTQQTDGQIIILNVSIPLEQGNVFRRS